jgi:capsular exopolysaccharide synthesis family protein
LETNLPIPDFAEPAASKQPGGVQVNYKRVIAQVIRFWYLIVLSLLAALSIAYLVNRYSTRVYPVTASIIIKEHDENVGAKFLYNNELLNPYRNFFNEIYIMKSYPLIQEVLESLGFGVAVYREGDIKTTEYYDPDFPVEFHVLPGSQSPAGKKFYFTVTDGQTFNLQYITDNENDQGKQFSELHFDDTVAVNGFSIRVSNTSDITTLRNKTFTIVFNNPLLLAKQYSSRLSATWAEPGAAVVNLSISGPVAQKEIDFLTKFIERYQYYDVEKKNKAATMALRFLDEQLVLIGDSLKLYEDQVENFKRRNIITNMDGETNRLYDKLKGFEEQKFQYRLMDNYFNYITKLLQSDQYDGVFTPGSVGITDDVMAALITELIALQTEVNIYRNNQERGVEKLMDNPRLAEKLQRISYVKKDIQKTIENSRRTQQINVQFINDQIRLVEDALAKLPGTERELITIQRNYSLKESLYIYLLQKRTEAGLSKASTTSDITIVNPPMAGGAVSPRIMQNYGIAVGIGLLLPLMAFVLVEVLNDRVQSKEDIEQNTSVPVIGGVGHNRALDPLIVFRKPRSAMAESFRALRSNLNYFTGNKDHQVFMVTSSIPGEGKSFTTLNIATVLAMAGKRTVILGADLRRPKLFDDLKLNNDAGLSQYLSGMVGLEEVIQTSEIENLFLIAGGPMPPNPSELLIRPAMAELMVLLKERFDFVIIDTPPLTFVTDAFVLSSFADHTLFVIRQDFTPRAALHHLDEFYTTGKLARISVLFNDLRKSGLGYGYGGYGYGYGYSYKYGSRDAYYE